ncbi:putative RNA-directed DNA polymerase from transposon X-element, partial [Araneus ventricosus]
IDHHPTPIASNSFENTTITITLSNSQQITVSSIYRPPHGNICITELDGVFKTNNKAIAIGDFNAKHRAWSTGHRNKNGDIIHNYICNNSLTILAPPEPTHFPHHFNNPSTLDFGILKNLSSGEATSLNDLNSDHNPVSFDIDINVNIPVISKILKTTNWSKFTEYLKDNIPGNPTMHAPSDVEDAISKFSSTVLIAINQASKSKTINGTHRKLPPSITNKITQRNQQNNRWKTTYDPIYKRHANRLTNEIKRDIEKYNQDTWTDWLISLNPEDLSIYDATRKFTKKFIQVPPILDTDGLKYTPLGKANAFKYSLENSFQTNPEPYNNNHISFVNKKVRNYLAQKKNDNCIKLTSPQEIISITKKINARKATGPDGIPNKALKMLPMNAITYITK